MHLKDKDNNRRWYIRNRDKMLEYQKEYREKNPKIYSKEKRREEYLKNKEKEIIQKKKWYEKNRDKMSKYRKEYKKRNPIDKLKKNLKRKQKFKEDALYKLTHSIRNLIQSAIKNKGYKKTNKTNDILGCSFKEFKIHIENKFEPWMNWNNYGQYTGKQKETWSIDHIIPLATGKTKEGIIRLNHYTNLQPLDSYINQVVKRDRLDYKNETII